MIISHRHRYLFVEVPHTASSAIAAELCEHYGGEPILYKHANWSQFRARASADERRYFIFATVRNPLDAAVTEYFKYATNHIGAYTDPECRAENGGWVEARQVERYAFVAENRATFDRFFARYYTAVFHNWVLVGKFDRVMRFENIAAEFADVLETLRLEPVRDLPLWNPTKRDAGFTTFYTPEIRWQAVRTMGPFMQKWGYAFPDDWGPQSVPLASRIAFRTLDGAVGLAASALPLDPKSRTLQRIKRLLRPAL